LHAFLHLEPAGLPDAFDGESQVIVGAVCQDKLSASVREVIMSE
jgi:hypothetical protein